MFKKEKKMTNFLVTFFDGFVKKGDGNCYNLFQLFCCKEGDDDNVVAFFYGGGVVKKLMVTSYHYLFFVFL
jgi:hypothetical protein